jgi:hypothetical protein
MNRQQLIQSIVARKLANAEKSKVFCVCLGGSNATNRVLCFGSGAARPTNRPMAVKAS